MTVKSAPGLRIFALVLLFSFYAKNKLLINAKKALHYLGSCLPIFYFFRYNSLPPPLSLTSRNMYFIFVIQNHGFPSEVIFFFRLCLYAYQSSSPNTLQLALNLIEFLCIFLTEALTSPSLETLL